ncbi:helix-turn-helix transcriptional regulator [Phormidium sp. FACHB-592]|uniref:Helix-turn-helix domain-containing protein n=1 Tax=Stenomitos frigidus AS-A4 TaxID=2933935 RepID=A0ABV0KM71_9CYAN|nr:helix-turn-helix transcriptional regulator [Phormidium sp. FACHB-592]MBD2072682.1 helix-turn-helix transcriptional regulator [Phormidium sp. FACHB-592]
MLTVIQMNMKELREKAKLSAEAVAFRLGVSHSTVRNWESGKTEPSIGVIKTAELIHLYECTFEDLVQAVRESSIRDEAKPLGTTTPARESNTDNL